MTGDCNRNEAGRGFCLLQSHREGSRRIRQFRSDLRQILLTLTVPNGLINFPAYGAFCSSRGG